MRRDEILVAILLVLAVTIPFLDKPIHIDDTFVLHVTGSILRSFWDPFSGQIDWFGYEMEVWKATTNPPLLSYYLAPFALLSDYSEIVLHLGMVPFFLVLAFSMQSLSRRFVSSGYWPLLFLMTSVAVVVSGNLMRDIPGAALGLAGVACFVRGTDRDQKSLLFWGAVFAGLAVLTKYSAAVVVPVMALYALSTGKWRYLPWLLISGFMLGVWCLHNWLVHGQVHILYLFLERRSTGSIVWQDKFFGAMTVIGSSCLLFPALIAKSVRKRLWFLLSCSLFLVVGVVVWIRIFYPSELDLEYLFWSGAGVLFLSIPVLAVMNAKRWNRDWFFLVAWFGSVVFFSVFMVPFQAVRHLLPALPPLLLLSFSFLKTSELSRAGVARTTLIVLLLVQIGLSLVVQLADYEYAATYRDFAESIKASNDTIWYVGHWGWKFYADRSGFLQLHRDGPYPNGGDFLLWPKKVHIGRVFLNERGIRDHLELASQKIYDGSIPVRTMDPDSGAGFYSVGPGKLPYRFFPQTPLEAMRIYRVAEESGIRSR